MNAPNVLRQPVQSSEMPASLFGRPSGRSYRSAVAQIIREIKSKNRLSNEQLAEQIGCSESTVYNAEREEGNLAAPTLLAIAFSFGEEAIHAVRQLYLCKPAETLTPTDRILRARQELDLALKEMGA